MSDGIYPSVGFYFQVKIGRETYSFKEVSGISTEINTEEIAEGGENRFKYKVPKDVKYSNLELKRGILQKESALVKWVNETLQLGFSNPISPKTIEVSLLNEKGSVTISWNFVGSWPIGWNVASLNSMNNEVLIESITLSYNFFTSKIIRK